MNEENQIMICIGLLFLHLVGIIYVYANIETFERLLP